MPNPLTLEQLEAAKTAISNGRVLDFYNYMASQGYGYANLAKGVVQCSLPSGGSTAQAFMTVRAAELGISLPPEKVVALERIWRRARRTSWSCCRRQTPPVELMAAPGRKQP